MWWSLLPCRAKPSSMSWPRFVNTRALLKAESEIPLASIQHLARRSVSSTGATSNGNDKNPTFYDILGLDATASSNDIKMAFYELSKMYHPDTTTTPSPESTRKFHDISEAFAVLSNPKTRRAYDRGTLGRMSSVADHEATLHRFEGDTFMDSSKAFRAIYGDHRSETSNLDYWMKQQRSKTFRREQQRKRAPPSDSYRSAKASYDQSTSSSGRSIKAISVAFILITLFLLVELRS